MNRYECQCGRIIDRVPSKVNKYCKDCKPQDNNKKHGMSDAYIYKVWAGMKNRCRKNDYRHKRYYDRGISVCKEWLDFDNFLSWANSSGYEHGLVIDREDNNKGYCPENCRWVTYAENARNKSNGVFRELVIDIKRMYKSGMRCIDISKKTGVNYGTVYAIVTEKTWRGVE